MIDNQTIHLASIPSPPPKFSRTPYSANARCSGLCAAICGSPAWYAISRIGLDRRCTNTRPGQPLASVLPDQLILFLSEEFPLSFGRSELRKLYKDASSKVSVCYKEISLDRISAQELPVRKRCTGPGNMWTSRHAA